MDSRRNTSFDLRPAISDFRVFSIADERLIGSKKSVVASQRRRRQHCSLCSFVGQTASSVAMASLYYTANWKSALETCRLVQTGNNPHIIGVLLYSRINIPTLETVLIALESGYEIPVMIQVGYEHFKMSKYVQSKWARSGALSLLHLLLVLVTCLRWQFSYLIIMTWPGRLNEGGWSLSELKEFAVS